MNFAWNTSVLSGRLKNRRDLSGGIRRLHSAFDWNAEGTAASCYRQEHLKVIGILECESPGVNNGGGALEGKRAYKGLWQRALLFYRFSSVLVVVKAEKQVGINIVGNACR